MTPYVVVRRILAVARPALRPLIGSGAARMVGQLVAVGIFAVGGWAVGSVVDGSHPSWVTLVAVLVALALLRGGCSYLEQYYGHLTAFRVLDLIRRAVFDALARQAPLDTRTRRSGDLLAVAVKDVNRLEVFFAHALVPLAAALVMPVVFGLVYLSVLPSVALVALGSYLLCLVLPLLGRGFAAQYGKDLAEARADLTALTTDTVQASRDVLGFQQGPARVEALAEPQGRLAQAARGKGLLDATRELVITVLPLAATLVSAGLLLAAAGRADLAWAPALACLAAVLPSHTPVTTVAETMADASDSWGSARRVAAILEAQPALAEPETPSPVPAGTPTVVFDRVSLRYPEGPVVVRKVSLTLEPGQSVALVGPTGSGKSTLAAAVPRLLDPDPGVIRLDGTDLRELALDDLRDVVALVPQRDHLFDGTVRDNLLLACPGASEESLQRITRTAGLHDPERGWDLAQGLETTVGARGTAVSGGPRQRLALARGLLRTATRGEGKARVLVLDEATSELDEATQTVVALAVAEHCRRGGSALIVAHRLATVVHCDQILYLDQGQIVERGSHRELLAHGGEYARAWEAQSGSERQRAMLDRA